MFDPETVERYAVCSPDAVSLVPIAGRYGGEESDAQRVVLAADYDQLLSLYREATNDKPLCVMRVNGWDKGTSGVSIACPIHIPGHIIP